MPPLSPELIAELGRRLRQSRADLLVHFHARTDAAEGESPSIGPRSHMVTGDDAPEAEMIGDDEARLASHDETTLQQVDAALARLESGAAGICTVCGQEIAPERLLANPAADTCLDCQAAVEHLRRSGRGPSL